MLPYTNPVVQFLQNIFLRLFRRKASRPVTPEVLPTPPEHPVSPDTSATPEAPAVEIKPAVPPLGIELRHEIITERKRKVYVVTDGNIEGRFPEHVNTDRNWHGLYTVGELTIRGFIETSSAMLQNLEMTDSSINVMSAVSDNEGKLEAINAYDGAFLSFGIFQWTLGVGEFDGELPALLKKLKANYPEAFELYFGRFGLDIDEQTGNTYGFLTLNGKKLKPRQEKKLLRNWDWVYRFWRAGQDPRVQAVQIVHALSRLQNFYWKQKAHGFTLNQIITSEFGVGLLLDNHVNVPALTVECVAAAMDRTGLKDPSNWTTNEEQRVLEAYLQLRPTFRWKGSGPMFDAHKRGENTRKYLKAGLISDERNSFRYSPTTRSLRNEVPPPAGYNPADFPDIRMEEQ